MSTQKFSSPCERMRYMALKDGNGSAADKTWRKHATNCPQCQAAARVMDLLYLQNPKDACTAVPSEQLLARAKDRFGERRSILKGIAGYAWKVAVCAAVIMTAAALFPTEWLLDKGTTFVAKKANDSFKGKKVVFTGNQSQFTPLGAQSDDMNITSLEKLTPEAAIIMPLASPGQEIDTKIFQVRDMINDQFDEFNEIIDRDLTGY